jgi:igA peptidase M64 family protein
MYKLLLSLLIFPILALNAQPPLDKTLSFSETFQDSTLRIDYIFTGTHNSQEISLDEIHIGNGWAGRRVNLQELPLAGNGQIIMKDSESGNTIYKHSFSTLFQEWQTSEEATKVRKSFENVFQLPLPRHNVDIQVILFDTYRKEIYRFEHHVNINDILIRPLTTLSSTSYKYVHQGGDPQRSIDVAIVAEGYTVNEQSLFFADAQRAADEILKYKPFSDHKNDFNFIAVALPSAESGISIPHRHEWKQTALSSHFDTFYSKRYLTTLKLKALHNALAGLPYEHILILANTSNYGGGGIYNSYTLSAAHNEHFLPVTVHEFGHSFGGLADEYFYDDQYSNYYHPEVEPWEQNITTLANFSLKWKDMLPKKRAVPTPLSDTKDSDTQKIGVYEGGGYMSKGVYRAFRNCRMRTNEVPTFCAVCERSLSRLINFHLSPQH